MSTQHTPGPVGGRVGEKFSWTIRRARKAYHCRFCTKPTTTAGEHGGAYLHWPQDKDRRIQPGDLYVEGDVDPYEAGGYGHERICLACLDKYEAELEEEANKPPCEQHETRGLSCFCHKCGAYHIAKAIGAAS